MQETFVRAMGHLELLGRLNDQSGLSRITTIPAGTNRSSVRSPLDADLPEALPGRNLYRTARV